MPYRGVPATVLRHDTHFTGAVEHHATHGYDDIVPVAKTRAAAAGRRAAAAAFVGMEV